MWEEQILHTLTIISEVWKGEGKVWDGMRGDLWHLQSSFQVFPKKRVDIEIPISFQQRAARSHSQDWDNTTWIKNEEKLLFSQVIPCPWVTVDWHEDGGSARGRLSPACACGFHGKVQLLVVPCWRKGKAGSANPIPSPT